MPMSDKIAMENVNSPSRVVRVDADKYHAMRAAISGRTIFMNVHSGEFQLVPASSGELLERSPIY